MALHAARAYSPRVPRSAVLVAALSLAACSAAPPPPCADLRLPSGRVLATLARPAYDASEADATCKPYLRVFAGDGRQLTKDLGGDFPHHRGVFLGWNQLRVDGATLDFWHCRAGEAQRVVGLDGGGNLPIDATVEWTDGKGAVIVRERRTIGLRPLADGAFALDCRSTLTTDRARVELGGDPQHAGSQFRALQRFAEKDQPKVGYVRPADAKARPNDVWTDCAWIAAVLPMAGGDVTVLRVEDAGNPPAEWSTRAYGRFGAMWRATLTPAAPLALRVVYVVADDARDTAWCAATAKAVAAF